MTTAQKIIKYLSLAFATIIIFSIVSSIYYGLESFTNIFDNSKKTNLKYETNNINRSIENMNIDIKATKLTIKNSTTLKVKTNNKDVKSYIEDNELIIEDNSKKIINNKIDYQVIVYLPTDISLSNVKISTGAGKVDIDTLTTKNLNFSIGAGSTTINDLNVSSKTKINGGVGKIEILKGTLTNLDLDMGVGKIVLNSNILGDSKIEAGIGSLNLNILNDKSNYKIKTNKGIGSITIDGENQEDGNIYGTGKKYIDIDGGLGSIDINFK